jgi:NAD+ synthase
VERNVNFIVPEEVKRWYPTPLGPDDVNLKARANFIDFPFEMVIEKELRFIKHWLARLGAKGVLIGLSGGTDSSTLAALAASLLEHGSPIEVHTMTITLTSPTPAELADIEAAREFSKTPGLSYAEVNASKVINAFDLAVGPASVWSKINRASRLRFDVLNSYAEDRGLLLLDTLNRSEFILGAFTEPLELICPLAGLFKSEVLLLGKKLKISPRFLTRPSLDSEKGVPTKELYGADWNVLDPVLYLLFDRKFSVARVARTLGHSENWIRDVLVKRIQGQGFRRNAFKPFHPRINLAKERVKAFSHVG